MWGNRRYNLTSPGLLLANNWVITATRCGMQTYDIISASIRRKVIFLDSFLQHGCVAKLSTALRVYTTAKSS